MVHIRLLASGTLTLGTTANSTYSLIVVNSSNALAIRTTSTTNAVPAYTLGDIQLLYYYILMMQQQWKYSF